LATPYSTASSASEGNRERDEFHTDLVVMHAKLNAIACALTESAR